MVACVQPTPHHEAALISPLSSAEAQQVTALLRARTRTAWMFTALAALATLGFAVRRLARMADHSASTLAVFVGVTTVVAALVWVFGWKLVIALRADLRDAHKRVMTGAITAIDVQPNAYGETITHVTVDGVKLVGRQPAFATWKIGQRVTVEFLPRSLVVFGGRLVE